MSGKRFTQQLTAKKGFVGLLYRGEVPDGREMYAYMMIRGDRYEHFEKAMNGNQDFDLRKFGDVLAWGFGDPPGEVRVQMEEEYGFNHEYAFSPDEMLEEIKAESVSSAENE